MIFIDTMKNLKIYKTSMFLPTLDDDKKKKSCILLLTPNYPSSKKLLSHPLFVNRLRYASYYIDRDVSYYINKKNAKKIDSYAESYIENASELSYYQNLLEMKAAERNKLRKSSFGLPDERKYPLDTEAHVRSAIKFFNYCSEDEEETLAKNIIKAINKFHIDVKVGPKNRLSKYYHSTSESAILIENVLEQEQKLELRPSQFSFSGPMEESKILSELCTLDIYQKILNLFDISMNQLSSIPITHLIVGSSEDHNVDNGVYGNNIFTIIIRPKDISQSDTDYLRYALEQILINFNKTYLKNLNSEDFDNFIDFIIPKEQFQINESKESLNDDITIDSNVMIEELKGINTGDKLLLFNEANGYDFRLKQLLYADRMKKRQELLILYDQVKNDFPWIKYAFPDLKRYQQKNVFIDLYYYNDIFFKNNTWTLNKGMNLYLEFMDRLINNPNLKANGYKKKTIFIPVTDWDINRNASIWNFRKSLNPISVLYQLMYEKGESRLLKLFGDINLVFVGSDKYFKLNFQELKDQKIDIKTVLSKFKMFLIKICKNEEFDASDIDTTQDNVDSSKVIRTKIADKIEISKGVDLTPQFHEIDKGEKETHQSPLSNGTLETKKEKKNKSQSDDTHISKLTKASTDQKSPTDTSNDLKTLAGEINQASKEYSNEEDALNSMDTDEIKKILLDLDNKSKTGSGVDINPARAARITELDEKLLATEIKGKTIQSILSDKNKNEEKITSIDTASPNEDWKNLSFMNFDKNYDINKDIIACFRYFEHVSRPISIRNISVTDNSTSEDRLELYKVEMEDYRGKRFTVKLDIPIMVDNRFLLRGNSKAIQTQFTNMPIIKTDIGTCQVISNYMKIFIYKFGDNSGKSLPATSKFLKAVKKYKGNKIKFEFGNNTKICSRYALPMDYIDIAGTVSSIETDTDIYYFNQDIIEDKYKVEREKGFPYRYNKKNKELMYYPIRTKMTFVEYLLSNLEESDPDFLDLYYAAARPKKSAYNRCSIMSTMIPLVVICGYHEGLRKTLDKANIQYSLAVRLDKDIRNSGKYDWIQFSDGYLIYRCTYEASLLLSGLKDCNTELFELSDIDNKNMYLEFLDNFGGRIKADGLDNFYDLMTDPITTEILKYYHLPTDYVSILLYANALLADNKFIKHTDTSSRRIRRYELIAVYTYKVLADAYAFYANQLKHSRDSAEFMVKQSAVIDKFLTDTITSDDSCINALQAVETTNSVTTKGPSGMNTDRAYSLDKRSYDESMLNILGMSTGFAGNAGVTRQATINANVSTDRGYVRSIHGDTSKMNTANTLTATEALTPFGSTHDDPMRTAMTFIQTAKHYVRTEKSDPALVTNGYDEVLAYDTTDRFAFKSKQDGKIEEIDDDHIMVSYKDGTKDYVNLKETIEKNSDGGYYVPLKLDAADKLKVGSRIKEGQILAYDKYSFSNTVGESDNIAYNIGKLAKVAIINTDEGFEDSGVTTEAMAEKLATRINLKYDMVLDKASEIYHFAKIGDHVECGDPLMIWQAPFEDEDANSLLKTLAGEDVSELGKRVLKSEVTGVVKGIKIFRTVELDEMSDSLKKIVSDYEKPYVKMEKIYKKNHLDISQIPAHYILPPTGKLKKAQDSVLIEFYVEYKDTVGVGDKIVYFAANKTVIKNLIPKGQEPYTDFRPNEKIDAFVSEISIDKRIVTSTLFYGSLQKLMIELDRSVKDIMGIPYDDSQA